MVPVDRERWGRGLSPGENVALTALAVGLLVAQIGGALLYALTDTVWPLGVIDVALVAGLGLFAASFARSRGFSVWSVLALRPRRRDDS